MLPQTKRMHAEVNINLYSDSVYQPMEIICEYFFVVPWSSISALVHFKKKDVAFWNLL